MPLQEESLHDSFPAPSVGLITGAEFLTAFCKKGVSPFVSLQAEISLSFEIEVSLAHLSFLHPCPPKGKTKIDKNDVIAAGRKDVRCQSRK